MRSKFIIALAFVLLGSTAVMAQKSQSDIIKTTITKSSFVMDPVEVIDTTSDDLFANASMNSLFFSPDASNDTIYVWNVNWNMTSNTTQSIIKRAINASTLQKEGDDVTLNVSINSKIGVMGSPGLGFVGFPCIRDSSQGAADNLFLSILPASADANTQPTDAQLTKNQNETVSFYIGNIWFQDDYFYILFVQFETVQGYEQALYLQAVNAVNGSLLFNSSVLVVSLDNPPGTTLPIAGANTSTNASLVYVVYKVYDSAITYQTTVALPNGNVDEPTSLVADTDTVMYFPDGIITSANVSGTVLDRQQMEQQSQNIIENLNVYYNGSTSQPKNLAITIPDSYSSPIIQSFNVNNGFALITQFSGDTDAIYALKIFNSDGSQQVAQETLAETAGYPVFFGDADNGIWLGFADFDSETGLVTKAFLAKVL